MATSDDELQTATTSGEIAWGGWSLALLGELARRSADSDQFRQILDDLDCGVLLFDAELRAEYLNAWARRLCGYAASELLGSLALGRLIPAVPAPGAVLTDHLEAALLAPAAGLTLAVEAVGDAGQGRWLRWTSRPRSSPDGTVAGLLTIVTDETARHQAEQQRDRLASRLAAARQQADRLGAELAHAEERYRGLVDHNPNPIAVAQDGRLVYANPAAARLLGAASPQELVGHPLRATISVEHRGLVQARLDRAASGELNPPQVIPLVGLDGQTRLAESQSLQVHHDGRPAVLIVGRDLSSAEHAAQALSDSETRFRALAEATSEGIVVLAAGRVVDLNDQFAALVGRARDELLDLPADALLPADEVGQLGLPPGVRERGLREMRLRGPGEREVRVEVRSRAMPWRGQDATICTFHDLTARHRAEWQLREAAKLSAIGQLSAWAAHHYNNLLTVIEGYTEFLLQDLPADDPRYHDLAEVQGAASRATALTRQLLAIGRGQPPRPTAVAVNDAVREQTALELALTRVPPQVSYELSPCIGELQVDRHHLAQVLQQLVRNACQAMPDGGLLRVATAIVEFDEANSPFPSAPFGRYFRLLVADTGCGMDDAVRERIFEPFFSTREVGSGLGLGLALVFSLVDQSGGWIDCRSAPGRGASFEVYLPIGRSAEPVVPGTVAAGAVALVVEDEPGVRRLVARALRELGFEVRQAANPGAGRELAAEAGPLAVLVTDLMLPGERGDQLAADLAAAQHGLPVVFISGYSDVDPQPPAGSPCTFLRKPFNPLELATAVREVATV
ncbi:MAG: PAS domain S-box protein [Fimbriimonadaceae bacterium]|nr:PAS domain S-box protein [Fimbriimonadaceae bacterium]